MTGSALRRRYVRARDAADLRPVRLHDLRHAFASLAIDHASPVELQAWAGHRDARTTARYTHYKSRHDEARRLAKAFEVEARMAPRFQGCARIPRPTDLSVLIETF